MRNINYFGYSIMFRKPAPQPRAHEETKHAPKKFDAASFMASYGVEIKLKEEERHPEFKKGYKILRDLDRITKVIYQINMFCQCSNQELLESLPRLIEKLRNKQGKIFTTESYKKIINILDIAKKEIAKIEPLDENQFFIYSAINSALKITHKSLENLGYELINSVKKYIKEDRLQYPAFEDKFLNAFRIFSAATSDTKKQKLFSVKAILSRNVKSNVKLPAVKKM